MTLKMLLFWVEFKKILIYEKEAMFLFSPTNDAVSGKPYIVFHPLITRNTN
jgi:hypothetical protein